MPLLCLLPSTLAFAYLPGLTISENHRHEKNAAASLPRGSPPSLRALRPVPSCKQLCLPRWRLVVWTESPEGAELCA